ncbi:hydrolase domain protein [Arthrobacter phage KellEzio]|uniref:Hydrolase domain protein n=1 Tax=Arthrobacter phage KellEzio TaxID=1796995 RepID=A0A140G6H3_9CAUD|nr:hydrolase domain protein [Arthrobacter phage KellEzio]AMM44258.1 hydrolase domain protein [Arthrobacter phage KellEzio]
MDAVAPMEPVGPVLDEIHAERLNQHVKWGEQHHPNGTGAVEPFLGGEQFYYLASQTRYQTNNHAEQGKVTYADILLEEVFEAMAEADPAKLRAELIQVAAVAVQWVQIIDKRKRET